MNVGERIEARFKDARKASVERGDGAYAIDVPTFFIAELMGEMQAAFDRIDDLESRLMTIEANQQHALR